MISEFSSDGQIQLHYQELAEHLPNSLLFILDRHLHVVFAGGSPLARSSRLRTAIVGMPLAGIMPTAVLAQAEPHLLAALGGIEQSYVLNYPTGEVFDVRAAPLTGARRQYSPRSGRRRRHHCAHAPKNPNACWRRGCGWRCRR
ncbi:MAG: hypothetical protein U1E16_00020 [Hyphomicrobiales bacterium]